MGLGRFELPTPRLSSVCSNQLSYRPSAKDNPRTGGGPKLDSATAKPARGADTASYMPILSKLNRTTTQPRRCRTRLPAPRRPAPARRRKPTVDEHQIDLRMPEPASSRSGFSRKEVIQPQVLLQLPCYDFTPITNHTLGACLPCGLARRLLVQPAFVM